MSKTHHHVQIANNAFRLVMPKKNLSVDSLDPHALVAPHVSAPIPYAANSITTQRAPGRGLVFPNLRSRDRTQAKSQAANLHTVSCEVIPKAAPGHCGRPEQY